MTDPLRIDECDQVDKPLLDQLAGLGWEIIDLVIDYVIAHELAHLIEANHTPRFWNIVRTQAPTMEKARAWLKEHAQILEQDV